MTETVALLGFRVDQLEKRVGENNAWRQETAEALAGRNVEFISLRAEVAALRIEVKGLRNVLVGLACTIAGSSVVFGLSILAATGKI